MVDPSASVTMASATLPLGDHHLGYTGRYPSHGPLSHQADGSTYPHYRRRTGLGGALLGSQPRRLAAIARTHGSHLGARQALGRGSYPPAQGDRSRPLAAQPNSTAPRFTLRVQQAADPLLARSG